MARENPLLTLPEPAREALAVFQSLRRLGFPSEAIFMGPRPAVAFAGSTLSANMLVVRLSWRGVEWNGICGAWGKDDPPFETIAPRMFDALIEATDDEMHEVFKSSHAWTNEEAFTASLVRKGIVPPKVAN